MEPTLPAPQEKPKGKALDSFRQVLSGFLILFIAWGHPISFGAFQSFYTLQYLPGYSSSAISWIGTTQGFFLTTFGLVSGPLFDLGYYNSVVCSGSFFIVLGLFMLSLSTKYYQIFLSQGICMGIGLGLIYLPCLSLLGLKFTKHRAIAVGFATAGVGVGGIIFTITFQRLIETTSFGWTVRAMGFVSAGTLIIAILSAGFPKIPSRGARSIFDKTALKDPLFYIFTSSQFFIFLGYLVPLLIIPLIAETALGASETLSLDILMVTHAASTVGRITTAAAANRAGLMLTWVVSSVISGILCFACIAIKSVSGFWAFCVLYGFWSGAIVSLPPTFFPRICPDSSMVGTRMGMSWPVTGIAFLVGTPAATAMVDIKSANFVGPLAWSGATIMVGTLLLCILWWRVPRSVSH